MKKPPTRKSLKEVASVFIKLGFLGFGGPAAHIAMMEQEVVKKRKWSTQEHFLDLVGATNLIPGPNSTEMAMHCGHEKAGWKGLIVAGLCFILPAVFITAIFAALYAKYGSLPDVQPFIYGIKPAIIAIITALMIGLGRKAVKNIHLAIIGIIALILAFLGINEIIILFGLGFLGMLTINLKTNSNTLNSISGFALLQLNLLGLFSGSSLFWTFLKIGSILYGSGYVLFAFLDAELVQKGILSRQELIDAVAVGQFTPGPVFSSATFIGWQISGIDGAIGATVGIFLPSFLFVAFLNPIIPVLRKSRFMSAFLDSVNVVSVAIILVVAIEMAKASVSDWRTIIILITGFIISYRYKNVNSAIIVIGGAALGYVLYLM